jgi:hypothetical protein
MPISRPRVRSLQVSQNGAVRAMIAVAGIGKLLECIAHRPHLGDLGLKFGDVLKGDRWLHSCCSGLACFQFTLPTPQQ